MRLSPLAVALALLQAPPTAPPQTFRSGRQLVEVDVRVLKDGKFVTDLSAADFELTEDGVPQQVESLTLIASGSPPPASGTSRPRIDSQPSAPRLPGVWIFVFDINHLSPGGLQRTRDAVVKFIGERFTQGDLGGVVADGNMINGRLTADREELRSAAAAVKLPGDTRGRMALQREWPRLKDEAEAEQYAARDRATIAFVVDRACKEAPEECERPHGRETAETLLDGKAREYIADARQRATRTVNSMDLLAKGLARIPGSKTIVFLSEGFRIERREGELRLAVGQATRAGAHVYTVDARGLDRTGGAILDQTASVDGSGLGSTFDDHADGLNSLAVDTGGFAIRNENNFGRALDQIQQDTGTYYVIAYSPTNAAYDGKYRAIGVKVSRPGAKVRARRGYLALEPARLTAPRPATTAAAAPPPEPRSEGTGAKTDLPEVPASSGAIPLSGEIAITPPTANERADASRAIETLKSASAAAARLRPDARDGATRATAETSAERGWEAYEKGDVETAAKELGAAAAAPDARPWVVYALGLSQFALRQHKEAAQSWERVRREVPEFEPVYFNLADAYGLQQDLTAALKVLRDAEARWPKDAEVANAIGVIHVRRGSLDAAVDSFERATRAQPEDALGYFNLARTCQMRMLKSQRYDRQTEKWSGGDEDRRRAVAAYEQYLKIGGPYERQAREALVSLAWK